MQSFSLDFYTAYGQFYLADKDSALKTDSERFWTDEAFDARLALETGVIGVGIESYGPLKAELLLLDAEPGTFNENRYDHIVEGSLQLESGTLQVLNCPDTSLELELHMEKGSYRVRIYSVNLDSVEDDAGDDFYKIEIWKAEPSDRKVLKMYGSR